MKFRITDNAARSALELPVIQPRQCGPCNLCCKVKAITEFRKPMGEWCSYAEKASGCNTYPTRPQSCQDYVCQWLIDPTIPEAHRPNRIGMVIETHAERNRMVILCDPDRPVNWPLVNAYIDQCKQLGMVVAVLHRRTATMYGPSNLLDEATSLFEKDNDDLHQKSLVEYGDGLD